MPYAALRKGLGCCSRPAARYNSGVGPNQATSVDDAIRAVTIDAARQIGQGDRLCSLLLGRSIRACPSIRLFHIADDGLSTIVHMDVLDADVLLAAIA
jgi:hypothetical protein